MANWFKEAGNHFGRFASDVFDVVDQGTNGAFNSMTGITANEIATQNLEYQKQYNEQIFDREDTAYQRLVEDLTAAGLNPAFGVQKSSGAGAGGSSSAPHMTYRNEDISKPLQAILNIRKMFGDLDEQEAKINNINVASKTLADKTASDIARNEAEMKKLGLSSDLLAHDIATYNQRHEAQMSRIQFEIDVAKSVASLNKSKQDNIDAETKLLVDSADDRLKQIKNDAKASEINAFYLGTAMNLDNQLTKAQLDKTLADTDLLVQKFDHLSKEHQLDVMSRYYDLLYAAHNNVSIGTNPVDKNGATFGLGVPGVGEAKLGIDTSKTGGRSVSFDDVIRNFGLNTF